MFINAFRALAMALVAGSLCAASPTAIDVRVLNELAPRDPMEALRNGHLEKRLSADFSLDRQWNNEVLFGG